MDNRTEKPEVPMGRIYNPHEVRTMHKDLAQAVGGGVLPEELPGAPRPQHSAAALPQVARSRTFPSPPPAGEARPAGGPPPQPPMPAGQKLSPEERLAFADAASRSASLPHVSVEKSPQYPPSEEEDILFLSPQPSPQAHMPTAVPVVAPPAQPPHREPPASLPIARPPGLRPGEVGLAAQDTMREPPMPSVPIPPIPPPRPVAPKLGRARVPNIPLLAGLVVISFALVAGGYWFFFMRSPAGAPLPPGAIEPPPQEQPSLQPLIPGARVLVLEAESLGDLTALFRQTLQESHPPGFIVMDMRMKTASGPSAPPGTIDQILAVAGIRLPNELMALMRHDRFNVFIRSDPDGNRPGIIIGMTGSYALGLSQADTLGTALTSWTQTTIHQDLEGLVAPLGGIIPQQVSFSINTHKNHCVFYQNLPDPRITIDAFVIPGETPLFALTTSRQSAWDLIDSFGITISQPPEICG